MSTRSLIAIKQTDGTVKSIYCHWDGYVSHNGRLLIEHYATPEAVEELLALGPLSALPGTPRTASGDASHLRSAPKRCHYSLSPRPGRTVPAAAYLAERERDARQSLRGVLG